MPLWSDNQRLALLKDVKAHVFWGYRSYLDALAGQDRLDPLPVVIADKGFINRFNTVFSINGQWGALGDFVVNQQPEPLDVLPRQDREGGYVLELGQDENDFSYRADSEGYAEWLSQWPERRLRPHPKVGKPEQSLADDLAGARLVVGLNTSALVAAACVGVSVLAYGKHSWLHEDGKFLDDREGNLRMLKSFEWDRKDSGAALAIEAALAMRSAPPAPEALPASRQTRTARTGEQTRTWSDPRAPRAPRKRAARSGAGNASRA